jgi:hypothetical protein
MNVRYRVDLSQTKRAEITTFLSGGKHAARRAQILLAADAGAQRSGDSPQSGSAGPPSIAPNGVLSLATWRRQQTTSLGSAAESVNSPLIFQKSGRA